MAEKCKYSCKTLTATWLSPQKYRKRIGFEIQTREIRNLRGALTFVNVEQKFSNTENNGIIYV